MATNKPESPESVTFRKHFAELAETIQDPVGLATKLYSGGIINAALLSSTNEIQSKQASKVKLLQAVGDQISLKSGKFQEFLEILKGDAPLKLIVENMLSTYGQASQPNPRDDPTDIEPSQDHSRKRKLESPTSDELPKHSKLAPKLDVSKVHLSWKRGQPLPETVTDGTVAVSTNKVYVDSHNATNIYEYDSDKNKWCNEIECKRRQFEMAVINGRLTIIGGYESGNVHNTSDTLLSLIDEQWSEQFKPMPTKRICPKACCSDTHLVVAGGYCILHPFRAVEIMNLATGEWKAAKALPSNSGTVHSVTMIGNSIYILWAHEDINTCCTVVTATLEALLQSPSSPESQNTVRPIVWQKLPVGPPLYKPCLTALAGNLLAIGGQPTKVYIESEQIHKDGCNPAAYIYDEENSSWRLVCHLPNERGFPDSEFIISSMPGDRVIVIGGSRYQHDGDSSSDIVHIGFLTQK